MDLDMWNSRSDITAQSSAWCGSGFMSRASYSAGGFRRSDPGLRRWRSMYHLEPESPTRSFTPLGAELWAGRGERSFRQAEGLPWLQDVHERMNTKLDRLRTRELTLGYNKTMAQMLNMEQKLLCKTMGALGQDELFDQRQQCRELQEKVLKLENELLHMKSSLENACDDHPASLLAPATHSKAPKIPGDVKKQEKSDLTTEVIILREALREAEARATTLQEERNKALQDLQTSAEMQKMVINQIEEMKKRVSDPMQGHYEVQNHLREANSKISRASLDKAVLSTEVLNLEDNVKEVKTKLSDSLSAEDDLNKEKENLHRLQDPDEQLNRTTQGPQSFEIHDIFTNLESLKESSQMKEDSKRNEMLRRELEVITKHLAESQHQLQELNEERVINLRQITDLEAERSQLVREKEELLSERNQVGHDALNEAKESNCQHSTSIEDLELENQKLQNQCLCLEEKLREKEKVVKLQEKTYQKKDEMRILRIKELEDVVSHWTEKWQNVALSLQSTQDELEELKRNNTIDKRGSEILPRSRFEACNQETGRELVQTLDKDTQTDLSESSLTHEPPSDSQCNRKTSPQVLTQSGEVQRLKQKLAETEREVSEREHDLRTVERLREMERTEAQIRISALELELMEKVSEDCQNGGNIWTDVSDPTSVHKQQDECREKSDETQGLNSPVLHEHPNQRQKFSHSGGKNEKLCFEDKKNKFVCPFDQEVEQRRRMVTEQLKSLFKEREGKEAERFADTQAAAQSGSSSTQDLTPTPLVVRAAADRRNWQQGSVLLPVLEEDEENSDWSGGEEGDVKQETHTEF